MLSIAIDRSPYVRLDTEKDHVLERPKWPCHKCGKEKILTDKVHNALFNRIPDCTVGRGFSLMMDYECSVLQILVLC